ncbi:MAG: hypothetical protein HY286_16525 [Planctomycetes bacterium]|nr:hypothetical protein [Planctomycetota bacterium]
MFANAIMLISIIQVGPAQPFGIHDQFVITGQHKLGSHQGNGPHGATFRFDRKLNLLGVNDMNWLNMGGGGTSQIFWTLPNGHYWMNPDCAFPSQCYNSVMKLTADLQIEAIININEPPSRIAMNKQGELYCIGYSAGGGFAPLTKLTARGAVIWTNSNSGSGYIDLDPVQLIVGADDQPWFFAPKVNTSYAFIAEARKLNSHDGGLILTYTTQFGSPTLGDNIARIQPTTGSQVWIESAGYSNGPLVQFELTDGTTSSKKWQTSYIGLAPADFRIGPSGDVFYIFGTGSSIQHKIVRADQNNGALMKEWDFGLPKQLGRFAFGPTGEEIYTLRYVNQGLPNKYTELVKLSLVTGQMSSTSLAAYKDMAFPDGDPTGYLFATVLDPNGDNDGDGYKNRDEVLAGYNPFDAFSHPGGPKAYLWFDAASNNALNVKVIDPDGIMNPSGGIDLNTIQLIVEDPLLGSGDIFQHAIGGATNVVLSPDGKELTITFGNLIFPANHDIGLTVSAFDLTGAWAWDWHKVPY